MSKLPRLLDTVSKFALFSVSDLKDEKLIKSKPTCSRDFSIFLPNNIKIDRYNFELYTVSKLGRFFETQCMCKISGYSAIVAIVEPLGF